MEEKRREKSAAARKEEEILAFWRERDIFNKTLAKASPRGEFVFYEGPPTANGRPGLHHLEARAFKDLIPRFRTMQGYHVRRKAGWDTHGLPVELEVEKQLGLHSKKDIETYGIAAFNEKCKESVWTYASEWRDFTRRIGFWVDLEGAYVTYQPSYMESLWHVVKTVAERGLLYKDYKVVPWCTRCGTALSSHELAQGYKEVSDVSVYVRFAVVGERHTYLLAWTTTPWTLPGNVALAVGKDIVYVKARRGDATYLIARDLLSALGEDAEVLAELRGKDLVGLSYEPLFPYTEELLPAERKPELAHAYKVYAANFVTTEEGTGIVHTAVMYGQDDFALGMRVGLPKIHLVNEAGRFVEGTGELAGLAVKEADTLAEGEKQILRMLDASGALFKKEKHTHTYPFCWRCKTPLLYYAHDSWYIAMSRLREELIRENKGIHWEPEHIQAGRFGEWLEGLKDWAISRDRFWGTPLPVWRTEDAGETRVIGSLAELRAHTKKSGNRYFFMRHGEAESNTKGVISSLAENPHHLTEAGRAQVRQATAALKDVGITKIIYSPLVRTRETAEIAVEVLGLDASALAPDERLREWQLGVLNNKPVAEIRAFAPTFASRFDTKPEGGETLREMRARVAEALYATEASEHNETILFVGHEYTGFMLEATLRGASVPEMITMRQEAGDDYVRNAEVRELTFVPLPHNRDFELDLHRPYIDELVLETEAGKRLVRVPEVMDVWFDSGSMPFAQHNYPFENRQWVEGAGYPADYICEAIDQTRGWFYTLHAVGSLMGRGKAFKHCICLGHILDGQGKKMSKSLGNIVNPWDMIDRYGVDALRFFMYSVNQPGESKNFDEKTVDEIVKKVFNLLANVVKFYEQYANNQLSATSHEQPTHPLDRWILARLDWLIASATEHLERYKVLEPARDLREFIGDLSQWYIRRSRDRFKSSDAADKAQALATTRFVLETLSKLMAPFMPFIAEVIYQKVKTPDAPESVHLCAWPGEEQATSDKRREEMNDEVLGRMARTREAVSQALELRARANIKVRQPLRALILPEDIEVYEALVMDEVNVKAIERGSEYALDTELTPSLRAEGDIRELIRTIQELRKRAGLNPEDTITLGIETDNKGRTLIDEFRASITKAAGVAEIVFALQPEGKTVEGESWGVMRVQVFANG